VIARTEGVTASFIKELLRRAALRAAQETEPDEPGGPATNAAGGVPAPAAGSDTAAQSPLRVTGDHLAAALDELLDTRSQLTRILLGGHSQDNGNAPPGA
jgi:hypothetical protein